MTGGEGAAGVRGRQGRRQPRELALKVAQVCRAIEAGQEGGLDSTGEQGLPVGGLGARGEGPETRVTAAHMVMRGLLARQQAHDGPGHSP